MQQVGDYAETRATLLQLTAADKASEWISLAAAHVVVWMIASGTILLLSIATADGKFTGYVKPLFKDMRILDVTKDAKNPLKLIWQALVAGVAELLTNRSTDQLGTRIPLSGTFERPDADILATLGGILKNAFIKALLPGLEGRVTLATARAQ